MAHGTLIGGAAYGITGGKCLVDGTEYSIKKGRTLVGGTGYDIAFGKKTVINVTKGITYYNDTYIQINEGEKISSTQTLEFEAGENVILFARAVGMGPAYPGIITINGEEVGRIEGASYSEYELDCTGHIVDVIVNDYNLANLGGTIDITTDDA